MIAQENLTHLDNSYDFKNSEIPNWLDFGWTLLGGIIIITVLLVLPLTIFSASSACHKRGRSYKKLLHDLSLYISNIVHMIKFQTDDEESVEEENEDGEVKMASKPLPISQFKLSEQEKHNLREKFSVENYFQKASNDGTHTSRFIKRWVALRYKFGHLIGPLGLRLVALSRMIIDVICLALYYINTHMKEISFVTGIMWFIFACLVTFHFLLRLILLPNRSESMTYKSVLNFENILDSFLLPSFFGVGLGVIPYINLNFLTGFALGISVNNLVVLLNIEKSSNGYLVIWFFHIFGIIFSFSGIIFSIEILGISDPLFPTELNWNPLNSIWYTVVTFTTVGYGDMSPTSVEGVIFMSIMIIVVLFYFANRIGVLINIVNSVQKGAGSFYPPVSDTEGHLIVYGKMSAFRFRIFLDALGDPSKFLTRSILYSNTQLAMSDEDYEDLFLRSNFKISYLSAVLLNPNDQKRLKLKNASFLMIFGSSDNDANVSDADTIVNIRFSRAVVPNLMMIGVAKYPTHQWMVEDSFSPSGKENLGFLISEKRYLAYMVGHSAVCPGVSTLLTNLFLGPSLPIQETDQPWEREYKYGTRMKFNIVGIKSFCRNTLKEIQLDAYKKYDVLILGIISVSNSQVIQTLTGDKEYDTLSDFGNMALVVCDSNQLEDLFNYDSRFFSVETNYEKFNKARNILALSDSLYLPIVKDDVTEQQDEQLLADAFDFEEQTGEHDVHIDVMSLSNHIVICTPDMKDVDVIGYILDCLRNYVDTMEAQEKEGFGKLCPELQATVIVILLPKPDTESEERLRKKYKRLYFCYGSITSPMDLESANIKNAELCIVSHGLSEDQDSRSVDSQSLYVTMLIESMTARESRSPRLITLSYSPDKFRNMGDPLLKNELYIPGEPYTFGPVEKKQISLEIDLQDLEDQVQKYAEKESFFRSSVNAIKEKFRTAPNRLHISLSLSRYASGNIFLPDIIAGIVTAEYNIPTIKLFLDKMMGTGKFFGKSPWLRLIRIPVSCHQKTYEEFFEIMLELNVIVIGLYRSGARRSSIDKLPGNISTSQLNVIDVNSDNFQTLKNRLPFVLTKPPSSYKVYSSDSAYVMVNDTLELSKLYRRAETVDSERAELPEQYVQGES